MTLPESTDRSDLLDRVGDVLQDTLDPIAGLEQADVEALDRESRAVVRLLTNTDPARFRELYDSLPAATRSFVASMSPLPRAAGVRARVELAAPPLDPYFPPGESEDLAAAFPNARLTVASVLDHTRPTMSWTRLRDFKRFCGFVVRVLSSP